MSHGKEKRYERPSHDPSRSVKDGQPSLDDTDLKILRLLLSDGRSSARQVARELRVATSTVTSRVGRMERAGIIKGYAANLDLQKLGFELAVVTEVSASKGKLAEMESEVARLPGVCAVYDVTGELDAIVIAKFPDRERLSHFTKSLLAMQTVERTNSHVVLSTVREDFRLPI